MPPKIAVIGLGLIGGSMALALKGAGLRISGFDSDAAVRRTATDRELVDDNCETLETALHGVGTVLVAAPVGAIQNLLPEIDRFAPDAALVLDTGSTKVTIVRTMSQLPGAARMVGGHPLAGSEESGPSAARSDLFQGRRFVLTPSERTNPGTLDRAREVVTLLGGEAHIMDAAEHDLALAYVSHLPQLIASALAGAIPPDWWVFGSTGLRDMTRLARSNPVLWGDIFAGNAENVRTAARGFNDELARLLGFINSNDVAGMERAMQTSAERTLLLTR